MDACEIFDRFTCQGNVSSPQAPLHSLSLLTATFHVKRKEMVKCSNWIPKNNSNVHFLNCNARTQFWRLKGQLRSSYRRPHPNKRNILTIFNETKKKSISRRQLKYFMLLIFFLNIFHIFCSLENIHSIGLTWIASFVLFRWAI